MTMTSSIKSHKRRTRKKRDFGKFCLRHQKRDNNFSLRAAAIPTRVVCVCITYIRTIL